MSINSNVCNKKKIYFSSALNSSQDQISDECSDDEKNKLIKNLIVPESINDISSEKFIQLQTQKHPNLPYIINYAKSLSMRHNHFQQQDKIHFESPDLPSANEHDFPEISVAEFSSIYNKNIYNDLPKEKKQLQIQETLKEIETIRLSNQNILQNFYKDHISTAKNTSNKKMILLKQREIKNLHLIKLCKNPIMSKLIIQKFGQDQGYFKYLQQPGDLKDKFTNLKELRKLQIQAIQEEVKKLSPRKRNTTLFINSDSTQIHQDSTEQQKTIVLGNVDNRKSIQKLPLLFHQQPTQQSKSIQVSPHRYKSNQERINNYSSIYENKDNSKEGKIVEKFFKKINEQQNNIIEKRQSSEESNLECNEYVQLKQFKKLIDNYLNKVRDQYNISLQQSMKIINITMIKIINQHIQQIEQYNFETNKQLKSKYLFLQEKLQDLQKAYKYQQQLDNMPKVGNNIINKLIENKDNFRQIKEYYELLKVCEYPQEDFAQTLLHVKNMGDLWEEKETLEEVRKYHQVKWNDNGLMSIQKYEHNKFNKDLNRRKKELKMMKIG